MARLNAADRYGRFRAYAPHAPKGGTITLHSKVAIVDDRLIRLGSSNPNNRSLGFDTECDVAVEGENGRRIREAIRATRTQFIAHFLGCSEERFEEAVARHGGLIAAIEALDRGSVRRLRPMRPTGAGPIGALVAWPDIGDPSGTAENWRPWKRRKGPARPPWLAVTVLAGAAALAVAAANRRSARRSAAWTRGTKLGRGPAGSLLRSLTARRS